NALGRPDTQTHAGKPREPGPIVAQRTRTQQRPARTSGAPRRAYVSFVPTLSSPEDASSAGADFLGFGSIRARLTKTVPSASAIFIPSESMATIVPGALSERVAEKPAS